MSPRTAEQFEEIRESRREQIMNAALELFASEGYSHCSIAQLAKHAGISKGLMYNYFESKEALLLALIEDGMNEVMILLDPNMDGKLDPKEVESFIRQFFHSMNKNIQFWSLFLSVMLQPGVKAYLDDQPFSNVMEHFAPKLLTYFTEMGYDDPMLEMLTISAMIEGYGSLLLFVETGNNFPPEILRKYEDRMVEMFTRNQQK